MRKKHLTTVQVDQILIRVKQGDSYTRIAQDFGVVGNSISRIAKKHGIERPRAKETKPRKQQSIYKAEVLELRALGMGIRPIALELNISRQWVSKIIKNNESKT